MNNRNRCTSAIALDSCGCQDGTEALTTPLARNNRPGLPALSYRIGTHASFLETMKARLSSNAFLELKNLTARDSSDPSIALLDAWAMVADVLTFYQERIANEGYLRTATEERSIQELARLVGAGQRSGVAATVPLAYTIDSNTKGEVVIPAGSRVQSVPGQNEKPQTFETSEDLKAYAELNVLKPRMSRAQRVIDIFDPKVYLKGINTNLKKDDRILIKVKDQEKPQLYRVVKAEQDAEAKRTCVELYLESQRELLSNVLGIYKNLIGVSVEIAKKSVSGNTKISKGILVINNIDNEKVMLEATVTDAILQEGDAVVIKIKETNRELYCRVKENVVAGVSESKAIKLTPIEEIAIYRFITLRTKTAPFGHNAPLKPTIMDNNKVMRYAEWRIDNPTLAPDKPNIDFSFTERIFPDGYADILLTNISENREFIKAIKWESVINGTEKGPETGFIENKAENLDFFSFTIKKQKRGTVIEVTMTATFLYVFMDNEREISVDYKSHRILVSPIVNAHVINIKTPLLPYMKDIDGNFVLDFIAEKEPTVSVKWNSMFGNIIEGDTNEKVKISYKKPVTDIITLSTSDLSSIFRKEITICEKPEASSRFYIDTNNVNKKYFVVVFNNTSKGIINKVTWDTEDSNGNVIIEEGINNNSVSCICKYIENATGDEYKLSLKAEGPGGTDTRYFYIQDILFFSVDTEEGDMYAGSNIVLRNRSIGNYINLYFIAKNKDNDMSVPNIGTNDTPQFKFDEAGEYIIIMTGIKDNIVNTYSRLFKILPHNN